MDLTGICRGCMKKLKFKGRTFTNPNTMKMFYFCMNSQFSDVDDLPKQFCYDCYTKIQSSYSFIQGARKVEIKLRKMLNLHKSSVVDESIEIKSETNKEHTHEIVQIKQETLTSEDNSQQYLDEPRSPDSLPKDFSGTNTESNIKDIVHSEDKVKEEDKVNKKDLIDKHKLSLARKCLECIICSMKFKSKSLLANHIRQEHIKNSPSRFECDECGKHFLKHKQLHDHMLMHLNKQSFACDLCPKRFNKRNLLNAHIKRHESGLFLCSVCGTRVNSDSSLREHMRLHTGEKPYSCRECAKPFTTLTSRRKHERVHFPRQTVFTCELCQKRFTAQGSLRRHHLTHTGERPYQCPCCGRAFYDSFKVRRHMMRTHNMSRDEIPRIPRKVKPSVGKENEPSETAAETATPDAVVTS